jgi:hypothetical protein
MCICLALQSYAQFDLGLTTGAAAYRWDKNPSTNSPEYKNSSGSVLINPLLGLHAKVGNESFRLTVEGYGEFAPFSYDMNQKKGYGTFAYGSLAKISIGGFTFGAGIEQVKTELYWRPDEYENMTRDRYQLLYGYIALSDYEPTHQNDLFLKVGIGKNSAFGLEVGFKRNLNLIAYINKVKGYL